MADVTRSPHHPTERHGLLLHAAFGDPTVAIPAFKKWREDGMTIDAVRTLATEPGEERLLPQVYRHLGDDGEAALAGSYRQTWARNRMRVRALVTLLERLREHGIPVLVLKGGALSVIAYADWGARPMTDFDLLVPESKVDAALGVLDGLGFLPTAPIPDGFVEQHHGVELEREGGGRIDLHWQLAHECCGVGSQPFWDSSMPLPLPDFEATTLCPTDHLFHVLIHGARSSPVQPIGWAADALALIGRFGDELDWERLAFLTRTYSVAVPVLSALEWLRRHAPGQVPQSAVDAVARIPAPMWERLEHGVKVRPRRRVGSLPVLLFDHRRVRKAGRDTPGLITYVRQTFRLSRTRELPREVSRLAAKRLLNNGDSLASRSAVMLAGELVVLASGVAAAGITSRALGVERYGIYGLVATIVSWVEMTVPMLFSRAVLGTRATRDAQFEAGVQWLHLGTGLFAAMLLAAASPLLARWLGEPALVSLTLLFAVDVPLTALAASHRVLLIGRGLYARMAVVNTLRSLARVLFIASALSWRPEVSSVILGSIAATTVEVVVGATAIGVRWIARPQLPRLDFRGLVLPLATTSISFRLFRRLDLLMLQALAQSPVATGLYGAAQNIALVMTTVNNSLVPTLMSSLSRLPEGAHAERQRITGDAVRLLLWVFPGIAAFAATADEFAALVYGEPFRAAGPVMALLAIASYAEIVSAVAGAPLITAARVRPLLAAAVPLLPLAVAAHLYVVPHFGGDGAAVVTLVLTLASTLVVMRAAWAMRLLAIPWRAVAAVALLSALSYAAATWLV
jgi:O-antigen/teichoic acid export membrane protein